MDKYFRSYPGNESKAIDHYHLNIMVSESFYPVLSVFEVSLRNSLHRVLTELFGTEDWYRRIASVPGLEDLDTDMRTATGHICRRGEMVSASKVVAELTLGFWVRLLNAKYEPVLWKSLRKAFPYIEKQKRQRRAISAPVNKIRNFRNRIFHHEPVLWQVRELCKMHDTILCVMGWIHKDLPEMIRNIDRVDTVLQHVGAKLSK